MNPIYYFNYQSFTPATPGIPRVPHVELDMPAPTGESQAAIPFINPVAVAEAEKARGVAGEFFGNNWLDPTSVEELLANHPLSNTPAAATRWVSSEAATQEQASLDKPTATKPPAQFIDLSYVKEASVLPPQKPATVYGEPRASVPFPPRLFEYNAEDIETLAQIKTVAHPLFGYPSKQALQILATCAAHFGVTISDLFFAQQGNALSARSVAQHLFETHLGSNSFTPVSAIEPKEASNIQINALQADIQVIERSLNLPLRRATGQPLPSSGRQRAPNSKPYIRLRPKKMCSRSKSASDETIQLMQRIINACAAHFNVQVSDILKTGVKGTPNNLPRNVALYLCIENLRLNYEKIGSVFQMRKDTVCYAYTDFKRRHLKTQRESIEALEKKLNLTRTNFTVTPELYNL